PQAEQLAEHLADLGRRGEVAGGAERVAPRVVAALGIVEAKLHVVRHRHRAADCNAPPNLRLKRDSVRHVRGTVSFRMAAAMRMIPASINGTDNSVPMVDPPHRNPSWGSGSRKCSPIERATAWRKRKTPGIQLGRVTAPA